MAIVWNVLLVSFLCDRQPFPVSQSFLAIFILCYNLLVRHDQISSHRYKAVAVQVIILFDRSLFSGLIRTISWHFLFWRLQIQYLLWQRLFLLLYLISSMFFHQPFFLLRLTLKISSFILSHQSYPLTVCHDHYISLLYPLTRAAVLLLLNYPLLVHPPLNSILARPQIIFLILIEALKTVHPNKVGSFQRSVPFAADHLKFTADEFSSRKFSPPHSTDAFILSDD